MKFTKERASYSVHWRYIQSINFSRWKQNSVSDWMQWEILTLFMSFVTRITSLIIFIINCTRLTKQAGRLHDIWHFIGECSMKFLCFINNYLYLARFSQIEVYWVPLSSNCIFFAPQSISVSWHNPKQHMALLGGHQRQLEDIIWLQIYWIPCQLNKNVAISHGSLSWLDQIWWNLDE